MTSGDTKPQRKDISAGAVWLACGAIAVIIGFFVWFRAEWLRGELGILEIGQTITLLIALALMVQAAFQVKDDKWLRRWLIFIAFGTFYLAGEETSWGQHYFHWEVGNFFGLFNDQGETNLHNSTSWLDQKPRAILLLGMILGTIVHPIVKRFRDGRGLFDNPWWLAPTLASLPPVIFSQIGALPERLDKLHLLPIAIGSIYRSSEMEEFFMYIFFITYMLSLRYRLKLKAEGKL